MKNAVIYLFSNFLYFLKFLHCCLASNWLMDNANYFDQWQYRSQDFEGGVGKSGQSISFKWKLRGMFSHASAMCLTISRHPTFPLASVLCNIVYYRTFPFFLFLLCCFFFRCRENLALFALELCCMLQKIKQTKIGFYNHCTCTGYWYWALKTRQNAKFWDVTKKMAKSFLTCTKKN